MTGKAGDRSRRFLTGPAVRERYGNCTETTRARWVRKGLVPPPTFVHGTRRFWDEAALDAHDDAKAAKLCRDIARAFEEQLTYPGEIKVTVVRESRFMDVAR